MAKLSDREVERFIAQASPDAARAVKITRLEPSGNSGDARSAAPSRLNVCPPNQQRSTSWI